MIAAIIGGGVIGGGWAARFLLHGWDVRVFDPDPEAQRKIGEVLDNARRSLPGLADVPMPAEGTLSYHDTIEETVTGAAWIQESVPERLDIKHQVFASVQAACDPAAVIGSSTSGFKPSELRQGAVRDGQIIVAHPFNPVYLLPLVELVGGPADDAALAERASETMRGIGMYPLHIRREIEAHIADRLLEVVWREALWLVKDGIATTEEIDNAIRYGFGLRWAQMGLFETYRIAGGEAGMKHFLAQFGPTLALPWCKLTDVPEYDDDLVDLIAGQSDAQSGAWSIRELERIRDANLVAMMRALKQQDWGAGALLKAHDLRLRDAGGAAPADGIAADGPVLTLSQTVPLDWLDYNGHMNESRYLEAFASATDRFMELIGCDAEYVAAGGSYFTVESHLRHLDEAHVGDVITVHTRLLAGEGRKMHLFHTMRAGEREVATGEHFLLHVNLETRRPSDPGPQVAEALARIAAAQSGLPRPEGAGRAVGQRP
ncbi:carnitine 3-dehydrogenase [Pontibaca methylaminivorans]|uniref:carnitine 3-dehydrogenase n=1 Tax=Pontibaca methylaminivorans TaxID=515897 RepID=UPI002FDA8718